MIRKIGLITGLKYLFSICLIVIAYSKTLNGLYFIATIFELGSIAVLSNVLLRKRKWMGQIVNDVLLLLFNIQMAVLIFGSSYLTMVMLTNLHSLEDLAGKAVLYISGTVLVFVFSFFPIARIDVGHIKELYVLGVMVLVEILFLGTGMKLYSPLFGYYDLTVQYRDMQEMNEAIELALEEAEKRAEENIAQLDSSLAYYNEEITDYRKKDESLPERPNVILIFTEGLSQSVISDERDIMPNVREFQKKTLSFDNYYNHTFATYRGLIGQLFSGYQLEDFDTNELVSLQDVFTNQGYKTYFINTEPNNKDFSKYLNNMGFYKVLGTKEDECNGMLDSLTDEYAYELLFHTAEEHANDVNPYFISIYTFGTHASFDTRGERFGDGTLDELNKFYDMDINFGKFIEKFDNSPLADNTIIIFTADHATYQDGPFNVAFPDNEREMNSCDEIPLMIYYKGIEPEVIDVNGRNTLGMTPTVLDYLDISEPNYFLGTSLFSNKTGSLFETSYTDTYVYYSTKDSKITLLEGEDLELFNKMLQEYYITKELAAY